MFYYQIRVLALICFLLSVECFKVNLLKNQLNSRSTLKSKLSPLKSAMHEAAAAGDIEFVMDIIDKDPRMVSKYDIDGQLCLHHAAKNGHFELVKLLVEKGPGFINFKNIRHRTPLHWAVSYAGYGGYEACEEICYFLIKNGADINVMNKDYFTPLDYAKKSPLGKDFLTRLKEAAKGVEVRPVDIGMDRVYWG